MSTAFGSATTSIRQVAVAAWVAFFEDRMTAFAAAEGYCSRPTPAPALAVDGPAWISPTAALDGIDDTALPFAGQV